MEGADLNLRDKAGYTALECAAYARDECAEATGQGPVPQGPVPQGSGALHHQARAAGRVGDRGGARERGSNHRERKPPGSSGAGAAPQGSGVGKKSGHGAVQAWLVGRGAELGSAAQAEKLAWFACLGDLADVLRALAAHPKLGQSAAGAPGAQAIRGSAFNGPFKGRASLADLGAIGGGEKEEVGGAYQGGGTTGPVFHGCPGLWLCAARGHAASLEALLDCGVDPNVPYLPVKETPQGVRSRNYGPFDSPLQ